MANFINDLHRNYKQGSIVTQLIYVNVGAFILSLLFSISFKLFNLNPESWLRTLYLPADLLQLLRRPWSLITYMFMHAGIWHLLFNMLWLYWFGKIFLYFFSSKHLRGLYFVGGLAGGLLYILAYNIFPYFHAHVYSAALLGASAAVLAIVVATAVREPNYKIQLLFFGGVPLKYMAAFIVVTDMLFMLSDNAGGHIAHLGGALAGWWFASGLQHGYDITHWINVALDAIVGLFRPHHRTRTRKPKMKAHVNPNGRAQDYAYNAEKKKKSDEIDRILEKLKRSGYESLTEDEKRELFDASQR